MEIMSGIVKLLLILGIGSKLGHADNSCEYLRVTQIDPSLKGYPQCSRPVGFLADKLLHTLDQCFKFGCNLGANMIFYEEQFTCRVYRCEPNEDNSEWNVKWVKDKKHTKGEMYMLPFPNSPNCYNSYFEKRIHGNQTKAGCRLLSEHNVDNLRECKDIACQETANVFNYMYNHNYKTQKYRCEVMYCKWNRTRKDYDFNLQHNNQRYKHQVYGLSHIGLNTSKSCNVLTWSTDSVILPMLQPFSCGIITSYENTTVVKIPELICDLGATTFQNHAPRAQRIQASKCESNAEGTDWEYYPESFVPDADEPLTPWMTVPYPGTPTCGSSIFRIRSIRVQRQSSGCDFKMKKIPEAYDLRQCMIHACELGFNVINYFTEPQGQVECELRVCNKQRNADYNIQFVHTHDKRLCDVYALHDNMDFQSNVNVTTTGQTEIPKDMTSEVVTQTKYRSDYKTATIILVAVLASLLIVFGIVLFVRPIWLKTLAEKCLTITPFKNSNNLQPQAPEAEPMNDSDNN